MSSSSSYKPYNSDLRDKSDVHRGIPRGRSISRGLRGTSSTGRVLAAKERGHLSGRNFDSSTSRHYSSGTEFSDRHHSSERYRSGSSRRSRSPSNESSRHRSSRYRSSRSRSRERSRSRSRSRSPTSHSRRRSRSPSWSRSSSHHRHRSRTPSPGADLEYDHGRNLRYFDVVSRSKPSHTEDVESALSPNKRSPSPIIEKQIYYPPGSSQLEASRKASLRITVDNDRFGSSPVPVEKSSETASVWGKPVPAGAEGLYKQSVPKKKKGKKGPAQPQQQQDDMSRKWGRDRDNDRGKDRNATSAVPVWMIPKVMNARDMDVFDDDIQSSRISSRATPPPDLKPPRPKTPPPLSRPFMKTEGKPRPEDINIFTNIAERSWDSPFLDDTPVHRREASPAPSALPGLGADDEKPLRSILRRKPDGTPFDRVVKDEPEEVSNFVIPGLGDMDIDDEDRFLYGEDADQGETASSASRSEDRGSSSYVQQQQHRGVASSSSRGISSRSVARERSQDYQGSWDSVEKSKSQNDVDQAKLESFLKSIGLDIDKQKATTSSARVSEDAVQRGAQVTQTIMDYYNNRTQASGPGSKPEKQVDSKMQIAKTEPAQLYRHQAPPPKAPVKQEPQDSYSDFSSTASRSYPPPAASEPTHAPAEHYASYPVQPPAMPPVPSYPSYSYEGYFDVRYPPPQPPPVSLPPPVPQELPLPHFAVPPPNILYPPPLMSTPVPQSWTPPSTQPVSSANRSNLKVIPLHNPQSDSLSVTTPTGIVVIASSPFSDKQTPTTPTTNSAPAPAGATDEIREPTTLPERQKLRQQRDESKAKLTLLMVELDRLRKQQGELMRKKQRQKDGHNDPQLLKTNQLISDIDRQVAASKKKLELMDQYLRASQSLSFVSVSGSSSSSSSSGTASTQMAGSSSISMSIEAAKSKGNQEANVLERPKLNSGSKSDVSSKAKVSGSAPLKQYRFIDNGDHWCKHCNDIFPLATDLLKHLHSKHFSIMETVAPADRPWATKPKESKSVPGADLTLLGFKGVEFMMPCQAFYCNLCKEFSGDIFAGRNHLESDKHNSNYSKFCRSNPNYVKRIQADRAASLARKREESKRKIEESLKDSKSYKRARSESSSKGSLRDEHRHSPSRDENRERSSSRDSRKDYRRRSLSRDRNSTSRDRNSTSRDRKSTSKDRELSEDSDVIAEDDDTSTKRSLSTTKSGIRLNLLKSKDKADKENSPSSKSEDDDRERIITISKPGAKIPIKIKGKGISASGPPAKLSKKGPSSAMTVEQQRTQRILSNMLKKMKHDKAEKAEAQKRPQPLEEFVCISSDGYVEDPKKTREREMAATAPMDATAIATVAPNDKTEEESQEKVTVVKITPNLPKMPSPKKDATEPSHQLTKVVVEEESLPEDALIPEDGPIPEVGPQLPKDFDGDFDSLTNVLTAIPLPPELDDDDDIIFEKEVSPPANNNVSNVVDVVDEESSQTEKSGSVAEKFENEGVSKNVETGDNSKESVAVTNELKESVTAKGASEEAAAISEDLLSKDGSSEFPSTDQSTAKDGLEPSEAKNSEIDMEMEIDDEPETVKAVSSDSITAKDSISKIADAKDDFAGMSTKNDSLDNVTVSNEPSEFTVTKDDLTSEVANELKTAEMTAGGESAVAKADSSESSETSLLNPDAIDRTESLVKKDANESSAAGDELRERPLEDNDSAVGQKEDMNENATAKEIVNSGEAQSLNSTTDNESSNSTVQENTESGEGVSTSMVEEFEETKGDNQVTLDNTVNVIGDKEQSAEGEISATDRVSAFGPEADKGNATEDSNGSQVEAEANSGDDSALKANNGEHNGAKQLDVSQEATVDDKVNEDVEMKSVTDGENVPAEQKQPVEMASESEISMETDKLDSSTTLDELIHKESEPSEADITDDILADANAETAPSTHDDDHMSDLLGDNSTSLTENVEVEAKDVSLQELGKEADAELSDSKEEQSLTSLKGDDDDDDVKADDGNEESSEAKSTSVTKERQLPLCSMGRSKRVVAKTSKVDGTKSFKAMAKSPKGPVKQSQVEGPRATMKAKSDKVVKTLKRKAKPAEADDQPLNVKTGEAEIDMTTEQTDVESKPAVKAKTKIAKVPEKSSDDEMKPSTVEGKISKAGTRPGTVVKKSTNSESKSTNFQRSRTVAKAKRSKTMAKTTKVSAVRSSKTGDLNDEVEEKSSKDVRPKPSKVDKSEDSDSEVDVETHDAEPVTVPEPPKRRQVAICSRGRGRGRGQVTTRSCTVVLRQEPLPLPTRTPKEPSKTRAAVKAKNTKEVVPVKQGTPVVSKGDDDDSDDELITPAVVLSKRKRVERQTRGKFSKRITKRTPVRAKPKPVEEPEEPDEESTADLSFEGQDIERTLQFLRNLESNAGDITLKNNSESLTDKDSKEAAYEISTTEMEDGCVYTIMECSHSSLMPERDDQPLSSGKTMKEEDEEEEEIEKDKDEEREIEEEKVEEVEDDEEKVEEVEDDDEEKVEELEEEDDEEKVEEVEDDEEKVEEVENDEEEKVEEVENDEEEKVEEVENDEENVEEVEDEEEKVEEVEEGEEEEEENVDLEDTYEQVDDVTEEMEDELLQADDVEEMVDGEDEGDDNLESELLNDPIDASQVDEGNVSYACSDISMGDMEVVDEAEDSE